MSGRTYYEELNSRDVNRHSLVYCSLRGDYMFRLSDKTIVRLNINISNIQATTMPCKFLKKFGTSVYYPLPCNNPGDYRVISTRCYHMNIYILLSLHLILLLFRGLVEKLMFAWRFNKFSVSYMNLNVRYGSTESRHCTLTYRQINPFHFFTPRPLRHFISCNTDLRVDSVQLWGHGDYPWCLTVAAAYVLWPLFLESESPRIFTVYALMIPHFTLWWNFWNPKSLQQFAGNIGGGFFASFQLCDHMKPGTFVGHTFCYMWLSPRGHNYCFVFKTVIALYVIKEISTYTNPTA